MVFCLLGIVAQAGCAEQPTLLLMRTCTFIQICLLWCSVAASGFDRPLVFGVNPIAEHTLFGAYPDYEDQVWEMLRQAGCTAVRMDASWRDIEVERGTRDWTRVDDMVRRARGIGAEPVVLIVNTPGWASPTGQPTHAYPPREDVAPAFEDFCRELAARTRGQVRFFEFWNEQNGWGWHVDRGFQRADEYLPWLRRAYHALKRGNPDCQVALGGMDDAAGYGPDYMQKIYRYRDEWFPGETLFDAVADHPYSHDAETFKRKINALLEVMRANGDGDKPIWITEYGWTLREWDIATQARELRRTLDYLTSPDAAAVQIATYLCIADFEIDWIGFGLCDGNLRPRPAWFAFRDHPANARPFQYAAGWRPVAPGAVQVEWRTRQVATTAVSVPGVELPFPASLQPSLEHRAVVTGLVPGTLAPLSLLATGGENHEDQTPLSALVPGEGVLNGDFEQGFNVGIARGWRVEGTTFCFDSARHDLGLVHSGQHAQLLEAQPRKGQRLDARLLGHALVSTGMNYSIGAWTCSFARQQPRHTVLRRVGVDPTGADPPNEGTIVWSPWAEKPSEWEESRVTFAPTARRVTVIIECKAPDTDAQGTHLVFVDDVTIP